MIGLDTVLFTPEGFKKLRDLNIYDEVLTPLGKFEPIMKMSPIKEIGNYVKVATDEIIPCSNDLEFLVYDKDNNEKLIFAEDLKRNTYYTAKTSRYYCKKEINLDLYEEGIKIPLRISNTMLTASLFDRYELLCGLMDTPICELKNENGVYLFKPHSHLFEKGLVSLFRLFGFPVICGEAKHIRYVKMGVQDLVCMDEIPIRDEYRKMSKTPPKVRYNFMPIKGYGKFKNVAKGRNIFIKGGLVLVGYSLVPVKCQIL